jgi:hypothetical protein
MIEKSKIIVRRVTSNEWIRDINMVNKDKIRGSFKSADGTLAKTSIGVGIDKSTGLRKVILDKSEQTKFEKALGMVEGTLAPNSDYWRDFSVDIQGSDLILDPDSPFDQLKLVVLKSKSALVADGLEELKTKSKAEFVIVSEAEEAKKSNKIRSIRSKAYALYEKMSTSEMEDVLIAMGKRPTSMSKEMIEDAVGREVDLNPAKFVMVYSNPKFQNIVFINKLLNLGILSKKGEAIVYEEEVLGYDTTSAIDSLYNPSNKIILESLTATYNNKIKNNTKK